MRSDRHGRAQRTPPDARRRPDHGFRLLSGRRFTALAQDVLASLPDPVAGPLRGAGLQVREVPPVAPGRGEEVPLAHVRPAAAGKPPLVVLYRRPLELRSMSAGDLAELIRVAVVREAAAVLGLELGEEWDDLG